ncbi:MAG: DUF2094 domain-containing protein [Acidobacteria bacterium]|nr:DUF2094 domain-containing protein [Acidobacteriota bacterium]
MRARTGLFQRLRQRIGGPKTVELPVSCYGKLPIYKDFLRDKLAGKDAQAFKRWLDRGISHYWEESDAYRGETIYPHAFLLRFPGTGKYVVGYLWGSHDQGQLRFFPFSAFVSLPAGREAFPSHAVLGALDSIIEAGGRWRQETAGMSSLEEFVRWSRDLSLQVTFKPEQEITSEILIRAQELTVGEFASSLWIEDADLEWSALMSYLDRHDDAVKSRPHAAEMAARFPSSGRLPLVLQAQYWTLILERFDNRRERPFQILIPIYEERAGITILLRNLRPDDVFALHPQMPSYEHIEDFRASVPRRANTEAAPLTDPEKQQPLRTILDAGFTAAAGSSMTGN